ncbi:hypothetical protein GA0070216_101685 [Micromonospora matsumotoense]|uniref:Uncharacterized protein n=1 Tax=Micromonospora matsumotoense TaxID=121616 RepID=A0A1C4UR18_9ACTN|nr:hypothetical protein [Micromonospora matsumotoense]SCE74140.1 hypothetical protein GA0070216_101685 [Micromonospora matsumotoense]
MPAKRSPKKSRRPVPSPMEVDPAALAALAVTPAHPVPLAVASAHPDAVVRSSPPPPPSRSGRPVRAGSTTAQGQNRRYAFRRS